MTALRVLNVSTTADTGGQGWALGQAFLRERPEWDYSAMRKSETWIRYPSDLSWDPAVLWHLWTLADVVHLRESPRLPFPSLPPRPLVVHHHGTRYRRDPVAMSAACRAVGAIEIASTLDLVLAGFRAGSDVRWVPGVVDVDYLAGVRALTRRERGPLRIYHSPTNRAIKSTDAVMRAVRSLQRRGYDVVLDLVERRPYVEGVTSRARADVVVDQLTLGYGLNAIESWAMGLPVVAGVVDPEVRAAMVSRFGVLPFVEATEPTLERELEKLVRSPTRRRKAGQVGLEHALRFHSQAAVVDRLEPIYREAIERSRR